MLPLKTKVVDFQEYRARKEEYSPISIGWAYRPVCVKLSKETHPHAYSHIQTVIERKQLKSKRYQRK